MTLEQFKTLCESCDRILFNSLNPTRIANNWLHVIRPHPIFVQKYHHILFKKNDAIYLFSRLIIYSLKILFRLLKSIHFNLLNKKISLKKDYEAIFVSNLIDRKFINDENDFYFHDISNELFKDNKSLFIYINQTNQEINILNTENTQTDKTCFRDYLSIKDEIKISIKLIKEGFLIFFNISSDSIFQKRVNLTASVESISPSSHFNLRIGYQIHELVKKTNPKYIFSLYEGFSWERLVFYFSKKANSKIKRIAYQHVFIFNFHHSIQRNLGEHFSPDIILASSNKNKDILFNSHKIAKDKIFSIGTKRSSFSSTDNVKKKSSNTILFLPEGDTLESKSFIEISIKAAILYPKLIIVIRFHPIIKENIQNKLLKKYNRVPNNWQNSTNKLEDDLLRCKYAIYRGSSTIIKAIKFGVIPVFYKIKNELSIDPIEGLNCYKQTIYYAEDIEEILKTKNNENKKNLNHLQSKVDYYMKPIDKTQLRKFKLSLNKNE